MEKYSLRIILQLSLSFHDTFTTFHFKCLKSVLSAARNEKQGFILLNFTNMFKGSTTGPLFLNEAQDTWKNQLLLCPVLVPLVTFLIFY